MKSIPKKSAGMIPGYSLFPLILAVLFNTAVYNGARMIAGESTILLLPGRERKRLISFLNVIFFQGLSACYAS